MNRFRRTLAATLIASIAFVVPMTASSQEALTSSPEVLVFGGTPAGIAAALSAARAGERVELIDGKDDLGGTLTDAMMDQWDLNLAPGGASLQGGIFAEMYARLGDVFTTAAANDTFASMLAREPNITVLYDTIPVAVATTQADTVRTIDAVTVRNERTNALETLRAPYVIDATDAGDVAVLGGARYDLGRQDSGIDERMQAVTEMFTVDDVAWPALAETYDSARYGAGGVIGRRAWGYSNVVARYRPLSAGVVVRDLNLGLLPDGDVSVNAIDVCDVDGLDARQLADAKRATEREAPRLVAYLRSRLPGFENARVGTYAPDVYVRETRHIAGLERLTTRDVWNGTIPADSVGLASYPIDLHPVDPSDEPAYAPERHVYGIPFGALVPAGLANLVLASPAISASHLASGSARTIPTTIEEGEADGTAAATAARHGWSFEQMARQASVLAMMRREVA